MDYQKELKKKILKINRKEDRKIIHVRRVNRVQCQLFADPHVYGFNKKNFEAQTEGDWLLYRGLNLAAHYRGKRFGGWVGPVNYGIRIFGQRIASRGINANIVNIDGINKNLPQGKTRLPRGGFINVAGSKITFGTEDGEEVDFVAHGSYFNAYVRSNVPNVAGICSQQFIRSTFFRNPVVGQVDNIKVGRCPRRAHFRKVCERAGLRGVRLHECVFDRCHGFTRKQERRLIREQKREKKKLDYQEEIFISEE